MSNELIIYEKYSRFWPLTAVLSILLSLVLFIVYLSATDILFEGYMRLLAFAFFALGLLSLFKVNEGRIEIVLTQIDDNTVQIDYNVRNKSVFTEQWGIHELIHLKIDEMPNRSVYNDIMQSDRCIRLRRENESDWIYLNKVNGRVIPLTEENAGKIFNFLQKVQFERPDK